MIVIAMLAQLGAAASPSGLELHTIDWTAVRGAVAPADTPVTRRRVEAVEYGPGYQQRLKIHRIASFAMIPFFIGSYVTGDKLIDQGDDAPGWARSLHTPFALGTGVLFTANTITGVWNLWASRKDPVGRTKRWVHSLLFLAADAGFAYAAISAPEDGGDSKAHRHRNVALVSMGLSVTSWGLMLFFK